MKVQVQTISLKHDGTREQREFWNSEAIYRALVGGIGSGKTRAGCVEVLRQLPGSIGMVVAPNYPMLRDTTRATFLQLARRGDVLAEMNMTANIATLTDDKQVAFRSAHDPDHLRGPNIDWFYMDEGAMCNLEAWLIMIGRLRGSGNVNKDNLRAWLTTTPRGRNWVWQLFGHDKPGYQLIRARTVSNTYLPKGFIENVEETYSERWRKQELEGEFIDDGGGVFRNIRACATATRQDAPIAGHSTVFGVDWGKSNDFTVISVIDTTLQACVYMDRFNQIDYVVQRGRLAALYERFKPVVILAEQNSIGQPIIEQLQRDGMPVRPFTTTMATKMQVIESLALAFEREQIKIIPDETLIGELEAYEQKQMASGTHYSAPEGMHDDCCISLALAWSIGSRISAGGLWG